MALRFFHGKQWRAIIDFDKLAKQGSKLGKYCAENPEIKLSKAAEKIMGEEILSDPISSLAAGKTVYAPGPGGAHCVAVSPGNRPFSTTIATIRIARRAILPRMAGL